jgi:hypothetical protein
MRGAVLPRAGYNFWHSKEDCAAAVVQILDQMHPPLPSFRMLCRRIAGWTTDGATSTSTGCRPVDCERRHNSRVSRQHPASAPTITSSTSRRIRTGTVGLAGVVSPLNLRSYRWGKKRKSWITEGSVVEPGGLPAGLVELPRIHARRRQLISTSTSTGSLPVIWW